MSIESLPNEIFHHIFSYLDDRSLTRCESVNQHWSKLARDDALWKRLFRGFPLPETDVKDHICKRAVWSKETLIKRVRAFADKLQFRQKGRFFCVFPHNPSYKILLGFSSGNVSQDFRVNTMEVCQRKVDHDEICFYMTPLKTEGSSRTDQYYLRDSVFVTVSNESSSLEDLSFKTLSIVRERLEYLRDKRRRDLKLILTASAVAFIAGMSMKNFLSPEETAMLFLLYMRFY